ncbi:hypothetical protein CVT26_006232, partial [Gymnopilus dilepis]
MQSTALPTSASQATANSGPADPALDEACRILTISSSLDAARRFVGPDPLVRPAVVVQDLSPSSSSSSSPSPPHPTENATIIPYTLSNRYYTADLHFALRAVDGFSLQTFFGQSRGGGGAGERRAPAVIFVWAHGEPYTKHIHHLSQALQSSGYEPE